MAIVLITGCSTGIGLATAQALARRGDRVYATARHPDSAGQLTDAASLAPNLVPLALDVCDATSVEAAVQSILSREPHIDVLVNNAGISGAMDMETAESAVHCEHTV